MSDCRFGVSPVNYPDPDPDFQMTLGNVQILIKGLVLSWNGKNCNCIACNSK